MARRRSRCTKVKWLSRQFSIPMPAPISSSASASTAWTWKRAFSPSPALPGGVQLKVGKMRAAFGKVNTLHNHVLPWTDRPLVTRTWWAERTESTMRASRLAGSLPAPKSIFLEGTAQIFRGDSGRLVPLLQAQRRFHGGTFARLSRPIRVRQSGPRRIVFAGAFGHRPRMWSINSTAWTPPFAGSRCAARFTIRS